MRRSVHIGPWLQSQAKQFNRLPMKLLLLWRNTLSHRPACLNVQGVQTKTWPVITSKSHRLPQTLTHTPTQAQRESVYTSCYRSIIPDAQPLRPVRGSDDVALPPARTMYPVPQCFGAIFLKLNKIVCTCSVLRQPFPNKTPALSTASESAVNQTHPQTSVTQTTREITATRSELLPQLIPHWKWATYNKRLRLLHNKITMKLRGLCTNSLPASQEFGVLGNMLLLV